nr:ribonuclease H-like domain-containing protein [Tanacetum cinerariifolium]
EIISGNITTRFDISLPEYEAFYDDDVKEISSGSTTTHSDSSLYDSFIFDLSINLFPPANRSDFYEFADELTHIISPPEYDCLCFKIEPNSGDFTMNVVEDIFPTRELRVHNALPTYPTFQLNLDFILSSESLFAYVNSFLFSSSKLIHSFDSIIETPPRWNDAGRSERSSYLSDFEELNGGYVAFGSNPKGGKIFRKGKIKTGKLNFDDVYFVKELKFNLFSVSQMCDQKNSVLFTDTECLVLSPDFKLPDESQAQLRVLGENNMYNVNLKNIVPSGDLTCLFVKVTIDESNLCHRRLGHINFKTMNKFVKVNSLFLKQFRHELIKLIVIRLTKRLLYYNSFPRPLKEFVSKNSNAEIKSFSPSPIHIKDSDSLMKEINVSFTSDDLMLPGIKDDDYDSERDILILEDLLDNYSLSLPKIESYHFDIPLFFRPPAKPPDGNTGILNIRMMGDISKQKVHMPRLMVTLVLNQEKSPDLLSHRSREIFQTCAKCPMTIHGKNTHILDVPLFHFYPLD